MALKREMLPLSKRNEEAVHFLVFLEFEETPFQVEDSAVDGFNA